MWTHMLLYFNWILFLSNNCNMALIQKMLIIVLNKKEWKQKICAEKQFLRKDVGVFVDCILKISQ